jgi:hypothetical protein
MPPDCTNWLMVSTSEVTRPTIDPRRSVFWVSIDRSWMWRKPLSRNVAKPASDARKSRTFTAYAVVAVTSTAMTARPT